MATFVQTFEVSPYAFKNPGSMIGSERVFVARELRELGEKVNTMASAIKEIQEFLKVQFP